MNLATAFRSLDHEALDAIYDNLPFVRALALNTGDTSMPLKERQASLAEALLLARDSFIQAPQKASTQGQYDSLQSFADDSSEEEDDSDLEGNKNNNHTPQTHGRDSDTTTLPKIQARSSSSRYQPYGTSLLHFERTVPMTPTSSQKAQELNTLKSQHERNLQRLEERQAISKDTVFIVPPTVNPYDPRKDYLPQWLKKTYMYWRWTLKQTIHDIPQRYAVWILLHLNEPSIRGHVQNVSISADEGQFQTSADVNSYILKKAAGHIKVQEDLARIEFNKLLQRENVSAIAFNSTFLRIFSKVRHFYHPDKLAIQYYDRLLPRLRKRLNANFYSPYNANINGVMKSYPTLEGLMLAAEQVDDFYRPLPPIPRKPGIFDSITQKHYYRKTKDAKDKDSKAKAKIKRKTQ